MTRPVSRLELRQRTLDAADMRTLNGSQYVPDAEVDFLVNDSASDLWDQLVILFDDYAVKTADLQPASDSTTPGVMDLPPDFYKLRSVYLKASPTDIGTRLVPFNEIERDRVNDAGDGECSMLAYKLEEGRIYFPPFTSGFLGLRYVYQYPWLNTDEAVLDINVVSGWDAFIVYDAARKLRTKAKQDASGVGAIADRLQARIRAAAPQREAGGGHRMRDVYGWTRLSGGSRRRYA